MSEIELIQGDCLEKMKDIPDGSIDLVLIDPPYINMVPQSWDRMSDEKAKNLFEQVKKESYRVLRFGGRFISFSSNDTLKFLYGGSLLHRELLVVCKDAKKVSAGRNTKRYKQHINCVEYVFVATKFAREYSRNLLLKQKGKMSAKEINCKLGVAGNGGGMWSIYTGENICQQVPTKEKWDKFRNIFNNLPEYSTFEEVFNNDLGKGNTIFGINFNISDRVHPTQKPLELIKYLISTYTNEYAVVLDAFMGSGTTGVAALQTDRKFIGIELDTGYFKIAEKRINEESNNNK